MGGINNTDLNDLLSKAIEAKPEFVPIPPLCMSDLEVMQNDGAEIENNICRDVVLFISLALNLILAVFLGCLYATSHIP